MIIGAAVFFVKKEPPAPEPVEFTGQHLVVKELFQSCAPGDRCIVVDTHCGFCCNYTAINARYEEQFNASFDKNCRKYSGNFCSCFDLSSYPSCVEGSCRLVPWPQGGNLPPPPDIFPDEPAPEPDLKLPPAPLNSRPVPRPAPQPSPAPEPEFFTEPDPAPEPAPPPSFDPAPVMTPEPEPAFQPPPPTGDELNRPFSAPPQDDLYAPLPDQPPPQNDDDLYKPFSGGNAGSPW